MAHTKKFSRKYNYNQVAMEANIKVLVISEFGTIKDLIKSAFKNLSVIEVVSVSSYEQLRGNRFFINTIHYSWLPDVIIYDLDSTTMSPHSKLQKINALLDVKGSGAATKLIFISSETQLINMSKYVYFLESHMIVKPFTFKHVILLIKSLLGIGIMALPIPNSNTELSNI